MLSAAEVTRIRRGLGLTQTQLGQLLGVHPLTVSKWEREVLSPSPHQEALLRSFQAAQKRDSEIGDEVGRLLVAAGVAVALYHLLKAAFGGKGR
jgi:transcriptional regulator with XRE-family HTH domain